LPEEKKDNLVQIKTLFSLCFVIGILVLNFVLVYPLFLPGYTQFLSSFEAAYLAEARFIAEHFPHLSYHPFWHLGFPFYLFYNPLLPFLLAALHALTSIDLSYLYRILTGIAYITAPLTLYLFVKYLTRKEFPAILAALAFSTPSNFLVFVSSNVWEDIQTYGFVPWRLIGLTVYGQGPHIIALALLPLASLFFIHTLKYPNLKYYVLTGIATAAVALTHWPSFIVLILMEGALLFSEIVIGQTLRKVKTAFFCWVLAYGFAAFWLNPAFLARSYTLGGQEIIANWVKLIPISFVVLPVTVTVLFLIFDRRPRLQPFLVSLLWFLIPFLIVAAYNVYGKALIPKPDFLAPELAMNFAILVAVTLSVFLTVFLRILRWKLNERVYAIANLSSFVFVIGIFIYLASLTAPTSWKLTAPQSEITQTTPYQIAQQLAHQRRGGRVLVYGENALWLNVFSDLPQVNGFSELGNNHPYWEKGIEEVRKNQDPKTVLAWLAALNVKYLVVPKNEAQKYANFLKKERQIGDQVIFVVPLKNPSLVKVVDSSKLESFAFDGSQVSIQEYQRLIEENPPSEVVDGPLGSFHLRLGEGDKASLFKPLLIKPWLLRSIGKESRSKKIPLALFISTPKPLGF